MDYLKNLKINNFRGLKNLEIDNLKRVNIFVGNNNTGKTSILEAIQIFLNPTEYTLYLISVGRERYKSSPFSGLSFIESMSWLFYFKGSENNFFEIDNLYIAPEYRNRGIAKHIISFAINNERKENVILVVDANDTPKYMYEKIGFKKISEQDFYLKTKI